MQPEDLELLVTREMPFGKHKGRIIADLPGNYLNWFAREGFPPGEIGRLLALLQELHARRLTQDGVTGLYYLSNMPSIYARVLESNYAFLQWFDGGVFSGDVKHIKPDPAIYQLLQDRYRLEPTTTRFIDDLKANVAVARTLGWQGIHYESPQQLQSQLALLGL